MKDNKELMDFTKKMQELAQTKGMQYIKNELQEYVDTGDINKLTMLAVKYSLLDSQLIAIQNGTLQISDLKADTEIQIHTVMEHGDDDYKEATRYISLMDFAKATLNMFEAIEKGDLQENAQYDLDDSSFDRLFELPDVNYDKPNNLYMEYIAPQFAGMEKYETFQNEMLTRYENQCK